MISPLFTTIVIVSLFILIYMKSTTKKLGKDEEELLEKERRANLVRRKPLDNLNYISFNSSSIPIVEPFPNDRIAQLYANLEKLYNKRIVNLTGISNTDLKLTYGPANLPDLTEFDQNYSSLARNIYDLGTELLAIDRRDEAEKVLSYGISIGSDISGNFIALANIYIEDKRFNEINKLIDKAAFINSLTKESTISRLTQMLDDHTTIVIPSSSPVTDSGSYTEAFNTGTKDDIPMPSTDNDATNIDPGSILPKDILDILDSETYKSDGQM